MENIEEISFIEKLIEKQKNKLYSIMKNINYNYYRIF